MKNEIWDPFEEMKKFRKEMDKMFQDFGKISLPKGLKLREPLIDVIDKKNELEITAELPGIDKKYLKISVDKDKVEIKAGKKEEKEEKKKNYYQQERSYRGFYKAFTLPARVDPDKAKVKFDKGILTLELPKLKQLPQKKIVVFKMMA
ncbi:MAG: Hsp20/alpha crystallin family protein [Nanoarchaeota archaeon]|nr:Hsp20/alpha crystallin family protein [Nanoarchaeota archaeon]MBU1643627.1 Hsp20/alpha crystallin family protein [Nanoarchaeota archaeon]MBU1976791.1 Hsp20/alpha crystallin family protein [Nanoarchaeota archaeon]